MKIVFLDRDGVINEFPGNGNYVTKVKDLHFIPGSLEAIRQLTEAGYTIFVISNQAGVGKGWFTEKKLKQITDKMLREVNKNGGKIKKVYYSIKRSDAGCPMRKPRIGSIEKAMKLINKSIASAKHGFFVGDTESDMQAGKNAGCKTIFVLSGREDRQYMRRWDDVYPDYVTKDLLQATEKIILGNGSIGKSLLGPKPKRKKLKPRSAKNLHRRSTD